MYKPSFSKCLNRRKRKVSERMLHTCNRAVERVPYSAVYYMVLGKKVITLLKLLLIGHKFLTPTDPVLRILNFINLLQA